MAVTRRAVVGTLGAGALVAAAGCAQQAPTNTPQVITESQNPQVPTTTPTPTPTPTPKPPVVMTPNVTEGATVPVDTVVTVDATLGSLTTVAMTYTHPKKGPQEVQGVMAPDGSSWKASELLEPGLSYALAMTGENVDGTTSTASASFRSQNLALKELIYAQILSSGTVGTAMPVVVTFDVPVEDKAAFEQKMTVTSTPPQEGSWNWLSSNEAHWRPKVYWKPGTQVDIAVNIKSVPAGKGRYGQYNVSGQMTIGRSVVLEADLSTYQMKVIINGSVAKTIPITGGKPGFVTRSGYKVLKEKYRALRMNAATVGIPTDSPEFYDLDNVEYAMRETDTGEFVHAAPWSVASQGNANVSHGCIGVSTENGAWLFENCKIGDIIHVTGTDRGLEWGNGWTDWNVSYEKYRTGSAL